MTVTYVEQRGLDFNDNAGDRFLVASDQCEAKIKTDRIKKGEHYSFVQTNIEINGDIMIESAMSKFVT